MESQQANHTPVLFLIYNRPEETYRSFASIAAAKPQRLYIAGDGSKDRPGDPELVALTRSVVDRVDWDCDVRTQFQPINLGGKHGPLAGIDWFFENEPEGIILEDDTVAHASFFRFASEMLARFRDDSRIMKVSGHNALSGMSSYPGDYFFSHLSYSWGWASWRRAWKFNDPDMTKWAEIKRLGLNRAPQIDWYTNRVVNRSSAKMHTWDYQWDLSMASQNGLHIVPCINMITNIGFNHRASRTTNPLLARAQAAAGEVDFPLEHGPGYVMPNRIFHRALRIHQVKQKLLVRVSRLWHWL
ncbi:hypothetical protein N8964_00720 [Pontimonas sp.]|nr:hypothetical protein [Pontimonas sp.]